MKGYTVHLLFHLLAVLVGVGCGTAVSSWLFGANQTALWPLAAAVSVGIAVLFAQWFYIRGSTEQREFDRSPTYGRRPRPAPNIDIHSPAKRSGATPHTRVQPQHATLAGTSGTGTRPDLEPVSWERDGTTHNGADDPSTRTGNVGHRTTDPQDTGDE